MLNGCDWLPRLDSHQDRRGQSSACDGFHYEAMVAREGVAPPTLGCRPRMILLHHRADWLPRLDSHQDRRGQSPVCSGYTTRQSWWPARVTLPVQRVKSPLHHFNACRPKWLAEPKLNEQRLVLAAGFAPALATLSTSCLCWLDYASDDVGPPAGVAPAQGPYKGPRQPAARR